MARIDVSTVVNKQRDIPKNFSSGKNSRLSPNDNNFIEDESEDLEEESCVPVSPLKQILENPEHGEECMDALLIQSSSQTKHEQMEQVEESLEIQVNKMITIRQGPQLYVSPRRIRRAPTISTATENVDMLKTLTPNEILIALVNIFSPPMGDDETPPLLDREFTPSNDSFGIVPQDISISGKMSTYTSLGSDEAAPEAKPTHLQSSASYSVLSTANVPVPDNGSMTSHITLMSNNKSNDNSGARYPPSTLGGALGIRRPRNTTNQSLSNNLTLDQLNPTLAEALAAMKSKNGLSKSGSQGALGSDGYQCRRDSLPTRMSGPVTLEALAPANSTSPDGSSSVTGHLVSFNGHTTEVPEEIRCHLCEYPMKLCIRKSKYKGEIREYAAYRCLRKGCQTFRSVRKVIEPDFQYPRKRKPEDSAMEIFDACNVSAVSGVTPVQQACQENDSHCNTSAGTLLFIPGNVTPKHLEAMQKFTFNLLGGATGPLETIPRPLFAYVKLNTEDINNLLITEEGQKRLQRLLIRSTQPPIPQCIIDACQQFENSCSMTQVATGADNTSTFVPQLGSSAVSYLPMHQVQSVSQLPSSSDYIPNGAYLGDVFTPMQNLYKTGVFTPVPAGPHPSCGMAAQTLKYDIRPPYYTNSMNW